MFERKKTVNDAIEESEKMFPRHPGQTISETHRMMERRQEYMRARYGGMPTLNDDD